MYTEQPLQQYLSDLASAAPAPGGGSAAALSAALAASLASMVSRLTSGKEKYADVESEIQRLIGETDNLQQQFLADIQADIAAYSTLSQSFKLPRATEEEKAARAQAVQTALLNAAEVPLMLIERVVLLAQACARIAEIGNTNVLSDIAASVELARSAALAAGYMVRVNTGSLKDTEKAAVLEAQLHRALNTVETLREATLRMVGERS